MNKNFERLRSSASESRMTRRIILSNMRMQVPARTRCPGNRAATAATSVCSAPPQYSFDERQPQGPGSVLGQQGSGETADMDDSFSKQVVARFSFFFSAPARRFSDHVSIWSGSVRWVCFVLQVKSLADSMDDSLTCQSGREDSQEVAGEGEEEEEEDDEEGEEEEEEEDEEDDYRECSWRNTMASSRRLAGRVGGAGGRGGMGGGAARHEDSTATSFSDVTLYMEEGCLPSSPLSRRPSPPLSRPASSSDTEYWGGGGGAGVGAGGREDSRETEAGSTGGRRSSTPCTECRGEYRGRPGGGGGGGGHLPVLTIEPPSDSSVDMSDRWVQPIRALPQTSRFDAFTKSPPALPGRSAALSDAWFTSRSPRRPSEEAETGQEGQWVGMERVERTSEEEGEEAEEAEEAAKLTPRREPSNTNPTAARLPQRRGRPAAPPASPCLQPGPCPPTHSRKLSSTPTLTLTCPPSSTANRSTTSLT